MNIKIKGTQLEITPPLEAYLQGKIIRSLEKRLKGYPKTDAVVVDIELARDGAHHHKGAIFRAEANISMPPKRRIRIEERAEDIRSAIDLLESALMKKLELVKGKTVMAARRRQRKAKKELYG